MFRLSRSNILIHWRPLGIKNVYSLSVTGDMTNTVALGIVFGFSIASHSLG